MYCNLMFKLGIYVLEVIQAIDLYIHIGFKVVKAIYITILQKKLHFTLFGLKSDHVRSTRYLCLTSVVFTTRTGG
jgi:hypothetical protein